MLGFLDRFLKPKLSVRRLSDEELASYDTQAALVEQEVGAAIAKLGKSINARGVDMQPNGVLGGLAGISGLLISRHIDRSTRRKWVTDFSREVRKRALRDVKERTG